MSSALRFRRSIRRSRCPEFCGPGGVAARLLFRFRAPGGLVRRGLFLFVRSVGWASVVSVGCGGSLWGGVWWLGLLCFVPGVAG